MCVYVLLSHYVCLFVLRIIMCVCVLYLIMCLCLFVFCISSCVCVCVLPDVPISRGAIPCVAADAIGPFRRGGAAGDRGAGTDRLHQ